MANLAADILQQARRVRKTYKLFRTLPIDNASKLPYLVEEIHVSFALAEARHAQLSAPEIYRSACRFWATAAQEVKVD